MWPRLSNGERPRRAYVVIPQRRLVQFLGSRVLHGIASSGDLHASARDGFTGAAWPSVRRRAR